MPSLRNPPGIIQQGWGLQNYLFSQNKKKIENSNDTHITTPNIALEFQVDLECFSLSCSFRNHILLFFPLLQVKCSKCQPTSSRWCWWEDLENEPMDGLTLWNIMLTYTIMFVIVFIVFRNDAFLLLMNLAGNVSCDRNFQRHIAQQTQPSRNLVIWQMPQLYVDQRCALLLMTQCMGCYISVGDLLCMGNVKCLVHISYCVGYLQSVHLDSLNHVELNFVQHFGIFD